MKPARSCNFRHLLPLGLLAAGVAGWLSISLADESAKQGLDQEQSVNPGINSKFLDPKIDIKEWIGRFEVESREVAHERNAIVEALKIKPGMALADIGAGTGLFLEPFAKGVGAEGKVFAVDISDGFVEGLKKRVAKNGFTQVEVVRCAEDSVSLKPDTVDLAFVCDTYHHFEYPAATLKSIYQALRPGGRLVVIDFERIPGVSRDWILGHVRAGKEEFTAEIVGAGFAPPKEIKLEGFKENYFLVFTKPKSDD
ncbi:MAG: class I SAM-dependent methyltransferase [Verrucomicrobiales bacterium]